jgi:hypothetical protein
MDAARGIARPPPGWMAALAGVRIILGSAFVFLERTCSVFV